MSSNYFQFFFIFFLSKSNLTAVGADNWNCMAERHLILKSRTVETFSSRRWWVCIFPHFEYIKRRHCFILAISLCVLQILRGLYGDRWGKQKQTKKS